MNENRKSVQIGLGASSILMIFVVLCMMILSVLSFSSALQNEKIAKRERSYQEAYYEANLQAEIIFQTILKHNHSFSTMEQLIGDDEIQNVLNVEGITYQVEPDLLTIHVEVNKQQTLAIKLKKMKESLQRESWRLQSIGGE